MKKIYLCFLLIFSSVISRAQTVQGTIVQTGAQKLTVYGKPSLALSNKIFTNINVCLSIPDQGSINPTVTMSNSYTPSLDWQQVTIPSSPVVNGGRAYYTFIGTDNGSNTQVSWSTGDNPIAEFTFSSLDGFTGARMNDQTGGIPEGGSNGQMYWYVEVLGTGDITNYSQKYYGNSPLPVNNLSTPSYVGLQPFSILPVTLNDFYVLKKNGNQAELHWETIDESNIDKYILEKSLNDPNHWVTVGYVSSLNNGSASTRYTYTDFSACNGVQGRTRVFYRLKILEFSGQEKFSSIKSVEFNTSIKNSMVTVFPNPAREGFYLKISDDISTTTSGGLFIRLIDFAGRQVWMRQIGNGTQQTYYYDTKDLQTGLYILQVLTGDKSTIQSVKLLIQ